MHYENSRRRKKRRGRNYLKNYGWKYPKFEDRNEPTNPGSSMKSKQDKPKKSDIQTLKINNWKDKHKERLLSKRALTYYLKRDL